MYTVKIIDGKPWVVEVSYCDGMWYEVCNGNSYPTRPEHLERFTPLENKIIEFGRHISFEAIRQGSKWITYAIPIPQPNEDEVWDKAIKEAKQYADSHFSFRGTPMLWIGAYTMYLGQHYSISKK